MYRKIPFFDGMIICNGKLIYYKNTSRKSGAFANKKFFYYVSGGVVRYSSNSI